MPRGDKSKYTDKQERKADHIAEGYEKRVTTGTAAANEHMLRVNRSLGYRDLRAFAWMESGVAALAERLRSGGNGAAGTSGDTEGSGSSESSKTTGESTAG